MCSCETFLSPQKQLLPAEEDSKKTSHYSAKKPLLSVFCGLHEEEDPLNNNNNKNKNKNKNIRATTTTTTTREEKRKRDIIIMRTAATMATERKKRSSLSLSSSSSSSFSFLLLSSSMVLCVLLFSSLCGAGEAARTLKQFAGMEQAMAEQQGGALSAQQKKNNVLGKGTIVPSADDLENPVRNENPALLKHIQNGAKDESEQTKRLRKLHKVLNVHGHLKTVADRNPDSGYFVVAFAFIILWIGVYVRQTVDHVNQVRAQERLEARALNNKLERKQFATGNTGDRVADDIALRFELEEAKNEAEKLRRQLNERDGSNSKDANVSSSTLSERAAATLDFIKRKD